MWRLSASLRDYDWGSATAIAEFLGVQPTGLPMAELWFGTHPLGMSTVDVAGGPSSLADVSGSLPFMLKVLAPAQPLSIQVHPSSTMAELGFAAEEAAGVALSDGARDFKDPFHKPEMVYALTTFETLLGLRPVEEIDDLLAALEGAVAKRLRALVPDGRLAVVRELLSTAPSPSEVDEFVAECERHVERDIGRGFETVLEAARVHPSDPGLVLALLLNRVTLQPGEAAFVGPGLIHAHLSGLCLEAMSASDNVFRAGMTTKRVNVEGVLESLDVTQPDSARVAAHRFGDATEVFAPAPGLFALSITTGAADRLPGNGNRILLCLEGDVEVGAESGGSFHLARGQALFASADDGDLAISGAGTTAQAFVP